MLLVVSSYCLVKGVLWPCFLYNSPKKLEFLRKHVKKHTNREIASSQKYFFLLQKIRIFVRTRETCSELPYYISAMNTAVITNSTTFHDIKCPTYFGICRIIFILTLTPSPSSPLLGAGGFSGRSVKG